MGEPSYYSTHTLLAHGGYTRPEWIVPVGTGQARPGDLVFPYEGHVAMLLADGFMIHTSATGDVSHVARAYTSPLQVNRVQARLAPPSGESLR
jgi:cell wall-associated NlpC family hydrolase